MEAKVDLKTGRASLVLDRDLDEEVFAGALHKVGLEFESLEG